MHGTAAARSATLGECRKEASSWLNAAYQSYSRVVLFFRCGFGWIVELASRRGWLLWMSLAVFGLVAVAGRLLYAVGIGPVRIAYTGGLVVLVIAPGIYVVGERLRSLIRKRRVHQHRDLPA